MRVRFALVLAAVTAAVAMVAAALPAPPAAASTTERVCARYGGVVTWTTWHTRVETRNDWWGEKGCISASTTKPQFTNLTYYPWTGKVVAYPEIYRGCQYGRCTSANSGFPRRVYWTKHAVAQWQTRNNWVGGTHNTAFDIWFGKTRNTVGHATGAELMIWLSSRSLHKPYGAPVYWIGGRRWWLSYWRPCNGGVCWNYVRFWSVRPTYGVHWLRLHPFIRVMERLGKLRPWWFLWNVHAGYEIWSGGKGMRTTWFWAKA